MTDSRIIGDLMGDDDDILGDLIGDDDDIMAELGRRRQSRRIRRLAARADGGQRELYLPFSATASAATPIGSAATLSAVVQRPIMFKRLILSAVDATTLADVLATLAVSNFLIGVQPVFNASGVAPAVAFAFNAVGNRLLTPVARVGTTVTVALTRIATGVNAATVSGYLVGVSADT